MQVMSSQDSQVSQETIVYPMEQDEEPLLVLPLLLLLHSLRIPPGDGEGGTKEEVQREHPRRCTIQKGMGPALHHLHLQRLQERDKS